MTETHTVHDPFLGKDVQVSSRLVDRLRGRYASGPTMANGEPEFGWREFQTPPIQHEAADRIEAMVKALKEIAELNITPDTGASVAMQMRRIALHAVASPVSTKLEGLL